MTSNYVSTRLEQVPTGIADCRMTIIADDLTGACDAAVAFADTTPEVRVLLEEPVKPGAGVWAISTDTRDVAPEICETVLQRCAAEFPDSGEIFKKVDSVFRGNTALEIATMVRCSPTKLAVIAPAYPALGRTMRDGVLFVEDLGQVREVSVASLLSGLGCATVQIPASADAQLLAYLIASARDSGGSALLCDATDQAHLRALVRAARAANTAILWIGSGGLARELAAEHAVLPDGESDLGRSGQIVFFVGSDHPVTLGQVLHLQRLSGLKTRSCSEDVPACDRGLLLSVPRGEPEASVRVAVSKIKPEEVGCLFMTGGDTARLVCGALGITSLRLRREFAPGVPLGVAQGGRFDGVPVLLKSGGFGSHDLLGHVLETFSDRKEVVSA